MNTQILNSTIESYRKKTRDEIHMAMNNGSGMKEERQEAARIVLLERDKAESEQHFRKTETRANLALVLSFLSIVVSVLMRLLHH
jgi:hypothetical protein